MNKTQWGVVIAAVAMFIVLYFGCDTKPDKHKSIENKRALAAVSTDISAMLMEAKKQISPEESGRIIALEAELNAALGDTSKATVYEKLSGAWYEFGKTGIAGYYAEKVAEVKKQEEDWSIAGTTYSICIQREKEPKVRSYCTQRAIQSLENAASLNPSNLQHKINLALVYAENPPQENPMKGVLMLVDLNKQYPNNTSILTQLGRLAINTGQFDKAVRRLQEAIAADAENTSAYCLLAQAYQELGDEANAAASKVKCEQLSSR
jgi:tetratricopeptide (TPR) repeat protein